jgi:hypothetical protein
MVIHRNVVEVKVTKQKARQPYRRLTGERGFV